VNRGIRRQSFRVSFSIIGELENWGAARLHRTTANDCPRLPSRTNAVALAISNDGTPPTNLLPHNYWPRTNCPRDNGNRSTIKRVCRRTVFRSYTTRWSSVDSQRREDRRIVFAEYENCGARNTVADGRGRQLPVGQS